MEKVETAFEGLLILKTKNFTDIRGSFQKLFNYEWFKEKNLDSEFKEFYFSVSQKNVIRGMHFQLPPHAHTKLVYVSKGSIIDVVIDLRKESSTYGEYFSIRLDDISANYLYIPIGFAHGFLSLENETIVNYAQTSCYHNDADTGILYNSFGYDWGVVEPIVSERDSSLGKLTNFKTVF